MTYQDLLQPEDNSYDPFDGESGTRLATLITLLQIRDILYGQLALQDDEKTAVLMENHSVGNLIAPLPQLKT